MANEVKAGGLKAEVILETTRWDSGIAKVRRDIDDTKTKGKDLNTNFKEMGLTIDDAAKGLVGMAASAVTLITGLITSSSAFKSQWAGVTSEWKKTSQVIGDEFQPTIEAAANAVEGLLKDLRNPDTALGGSLKSIADILNTFAQGNIEDALTKYKNATTLNAGGTIQDIINANTPFPYSGTAPENVTNDILSGNGTSAQTGAGYNINPGVVPKQAPGNFNVTNNINIQGSLLQKPEISQTKIDQTKQALTLIWGT